MVCSQKEVENAKNSMLVVVDNLKNDRLDFIRLKISRIKRYKSERARLPQRADMRLDLKA